MLAVCDVPKGFLGILRFPGLDDPHAVRQPVHVGIDRNGRVSESVNHHTGGGLSPDSRQLHQPVRIARDLAPMTSEEKPANRLNAGRLTR